MARTMAKNPIASRQEKYFKLSSRLVGMDNAQLGALLSEDASPAGSNWGTHQTIRLAGAKIFVKRIPVTELEFAHPFATRNLFDLPDAYHYGVGSTGFGVYRELLSHIRTSNWVLSGEQASFPLMYHYRIVPLRASTAAIDLESHQRFVAYWGGHPGIDSYLLERSHASHELLLFLEYFPQTLRTWLCAHPGQVERVLASLRDTLDFLGKQGIIHLDPHYLNVLTDGEQFYLSDFGLALDRHFALGASEKAFFAQNRYYDYGQVLWSLCYVVREAWEACGSQNQRKLSQKYGFSASLHARQVFPLLLTHLEELHSDKLLKLNPEFMACLLRYRSVIALMQSFYSDMQANERKDTRFRHALLRRRLIETGFCQSK